MKFLKLSTRIRNLTLAIALVVVVLPVAIPVNGAEGILDYNRFMNEIEPMFLSKEYASPGPAPMSCLACHGDTSSAAFAAFPLAAGKTRENFTEIARRVELDDPDTSVILLKPLALAAGGIPHGGFGNDGGEQFVNATNDASYTAILRWIIDATVANSGARITRTEAHPNPFRFGTNIVYFLSTTALDVTITLYTASGRQIRTLEGTTRVGANEVAWNGRDEDEGTLLTGVYFYLIRARFEDGTSTLQGRCVFTP